MRGASPGFTLIELVVAMAILLVVMIGVLSSVAFAYTSSNETEMRNTAKNLAAYTLEYLRSRTVTRGNTTLYTLLNPSGSPSTGTYRWYDPDPVSSTYNPTGVLPSMIDVGNLPLQANGWPCNYTSTYMRTGGQVDGSSNPGSGGGIGADGVAFRFASKHAASPTQKYSDQRLAFSSTLQGYMSVRDMTAPTSTENPALEDANLARMLFSGSNVVSGIYRTTLTDLASVGAWTGLIVRYPGVYQSTPPVITSFTPLTNYMAKVYTTDTDTVGLNSRVSPNSQEYNPYYTNSQKAATQAYRGFRVLTQVVARTADPLTYIHVQYYDVSVTVLWMNGTHESNYELVSRILVY